jgi:hypothetical protein
LRGAEELVSSEYTALFRKRKHSWRWLQIRANISNATELGT